MQNAIVPSNETSLPPKGEITNDYSAEIAKMIQTTGTLVIDDTQKDILYKLLTKKDVSELIDIREDGMIFMQWHEYANRLNQTFTGLGWTLVPQGAPKIIDNLVVWGFHLVIKGVYCGFSYGECEWKSTNKRMSYGDAMEGAKSNALTRLGKGIGLFREMWDKDFVMSWKEKYAESYQGRNQQGEEKTYWRKKKNKPVQSTTQPPTTPQSVPPATTQQLSQTTPQNPEEKKFDEKHLLTLNTKNEINKYWKTMPQKEQLDKETKQKFAEHYNKIQADYVEKTITAIKELKKSSEMHKVIDGVVESDEYLTDKWKNELIRQSFPIIEEHRKTKEKKQQP